MTITADPVGFDLLHAPWVPVRTLAGAVEEVSLLDVFARADRLHSVTGEVPTQAFALTRLLLAILHRCRPWDPDDPPAEWGAAWRGEIDLAAEAAVYLQAHAGRFDLLHPVTPFYQVSSLRTTSGGTSPLTSLVADVPNNEQYFTTRAARSLERISLAEAARWVVHAQAFDPSGIKSGAVDDPRVRNGKGYPIGTGWAGYLGGLLVEGATLRETLLLNLPLADRDGEPWPSTDSAVWEREPQTSGVEREGRHPRGPADQLTWQSRRIRLAASGGCVSGVMVANGDPSTQQNSHRFEVMTGWRRSEPQEKALKQSLVYMPLTHDPARALWRGLPALLPRTALTTVGIKGGPPERLASGTLHWLARMAGSAAGHLAKEYPLRTRAIGMSYGSQSAVVSEIVDDALIVHAVLLAEQGEQLRQMAVDSVAVADAAVQELGKLAGNLARAAGGDASGAWDRAREQAFFDLDAHYRTWLAELLLDVDALAQREVWERFVWQALDDLGHQLVQDAGAPAWVGREVDAGRPTARWVDSSLAWEWFRAGLRKTLAYGAPLAAVSGAAPSADPTPERSTR